jgi:hypothetical protein
MAKYFRSNGAIYLPWGNRTASFVDTHNIASVAAEVLTSDGHEEKIYTLTGPAALGIAEVAEIHSAFCFCYRRGLRWREHYRSENYRTRRASGQRISSIHQSIAKLNSCAAALF